MSEASILTEKQLVVMSLILAGKSRSEIAGDMDVSTKTIQRWVNTEEFQAELKRRSDRQVELYSERVEQIQSEDLDTFFEDLKEYRKARQQIYKTMLSRGVKILNKAGRRFDDLPEESIAPQQIPQFLSTAADLCEEGLGGWAELLAIQQLLKQLNAGDGSVAD